MAEQRMSFKRWYADLGEPVPLDLVPEVLGISRQEVIQAVKAGRLRVFTFRADNGKVYCMIRRLDLQIYGNKPLTQRGIATAFRRLMAA